MTPFDLINTIFTVIINLVFLTLALSPALIALRRRQIRRRNERYLATTEPTSWEY